MAMVSGRRMLIFMCHRESVTNVVRMPLSRTTCLCVYVSHKTVTQPYATAAFPITILYASHVIDCFTKYGVYTGYGWHVVKGELVLEAAAF